MNYVSQYGQDQILDNLLFEERVGGIFVDVGANDGISLSNSVYFERQRGWSGICIEADPVSFARLSKERSATRCLNVAAGEADGNLPFVQVEGAHEMLSGLHDQVDIKRIRKSVAKDGGSFRTIDVPVKRLGPLLKDANIAEVHYMSLDIEGGEPAALRGINFDAIFVHVMTIECNTPVSRAEVSAEIIQHFETVGMIEGDILAINRRSPYIGRAADAGRALAKQALAREQAAVDSRARRNRTLNGMFARPFMHLGKQAERW